MPALQVVVWSAAAGLPLFFVRLGSSVESGSPSMLGASWAPALHERPQRTAGVTTARKAGGVKPACGRQAALTEAMSGDSEKGARKIGRPGRVQECTGPFLRQGKPLRNAQGKPSRLRAS